MVPVFELLAPVVEVTGLLYFLLLLGSLLFQKWIVPGMELVDPPIVILLLTASIVFAVFVALLVLLAEEVSFRRYRGVPDLFRGIWAAVEENVGYRQLNTFWRLEGMVQSVRRARHDWGNMERRGFTEQ
jgi:hypothetical protein